MTLTLTLSETLLSVQAADADQIGWNYYIPQREPDLQCYSFVIVGVPLVEECEDLVRMPLGVSVYHEDGCIHMENDELAVFGCGTSFGDALTDFIVTLSCTWAGLKDCADSDLTQDAIELRDRLAWYLGRASDGKNI